jgi:cytochrome c-type biogenesis protein CcmH/NrfG
MDRIAMLQDLLNHDPKNAFARYGLAMEYSNQGDVGRALEEFTNLLSVHPDYTAGYFMAAQTLAKSGRSPDARNMLARGIACAQKKGDTHAQSEMQAMLDQLGAE